MIFSTKTMHASTRKADDMAAILPFWNRDDLFFLQYLHYIMVDFKLVRQF